MLVCVGALLAQALNLSANNQQVIDKDKLIDQAYSIAAREGISALSVRKLAAACGIAVGSVYMYFPTKADL